MASILKLHYIILNNFNFFPKEKSLHTSLSQVYRKSGYLKT
ncbi:1244_t:CDS:2 [Acaulospora morrowiae]|uniref:1244_t:CDS:1 n=1 Tax=Acaulospora morrowiae TaxID=94023 RepID=A0A9N8ZPH3_9GLOM|nr:1244_t:CDS:2 [Acaulospora morrowiae]